ncbi:MAG: hypothetical protein ACLQVD_01875 [Capsulimonadaceae bacterium]
MSSSRASRVVILCEDRQHEVFVSRYLKKHGIEKRAIVPLVSPRGREAGSSFVLRKYADEVQNCRHRNQHTRTYLIVVLDVDVSTVEARFGELSARLESAREDSEPIVLLLPRRNIETWIEALCGSIVNEETTYRHLKCESDCEPAVQNLFEHRRRRQGPDENWPPSLHIGYQELGRLDDT